VIDSLILNLYNVISDRMLKFLFHIALLLFNILNNNNKKLMKMNNAIRISASSLN